ncbi:MAG TPA: ATP-dependent Clp protease proteolytic subunit, partial [Chlamydiales bacterium]|nr:ATP-dependent Clp protease proteolytic subunit [Chlamydiales bacterium]
TGIAASMGSILMLVAPKERRLATPNSRIMIHQPALSGPIQGQAMDLEIQAREIIKTRKMIVGIYAEATGKTPEVIEKAIDRDTWYSAEEGKTFGFFNRIVSSYKEIQM